MIRLAREDDLAAIIDMVENYVNISAFKVLEFNRDKTVQLVGGLLEASDKGIVLVQTDDKDFPQGVLVAVAQEALISSDKISNELIWWVNLPFRGKEAFLLLEAYEYWAANVAKVKTVMMGTLDRGLEKVYEKRGYVCTERTFMKVFEN